MTYEREPPQPGIDKTPIVERIEQRIAAEHVEQPPQKTEQVVISGEVAKIMATDAKSVAEYLANLSIYPEKQSFQEELRPLYPESELFWVLAFKKITFTEVFEGTPSSGGIHDYRPGTPPSSRTTNARVAIALQADGKLAPVSTTEIGPAGQQTVGKYGLIVPFGYGPIDIPDIDLSPVHRIDTELEPDQQDVLTNFRSQLEHLALQAATKRMTDYNPLYAGSFITDSKITGINHLQFLSPQGSSFF